MNKLVMTASSISVSELISNRKYFSVSMRMFSTRVNENKHAVTVEFIDDIVANKSDYVCMPLCADVSKLKKKDYRGLTHLYDKKTGEFFAEEIGSFYDFEKVEDEYGVSLIGYARINKRSRLVCEAIQELYTLNSLNFSFEISAGVVRVENGVTIVDAHEENELTAMAVVSIPAYHESQALALVAEANEAIEAMFANATVLISEVDFETVRMRFYKYLYEMEPDLCFCFRVLLMCPDCVIAYNDTTGKTMKLEYRLGDDDDVIITDIYEVDFVRSEGSEKEMNENTVAQEYEASVADQQAEATAVVEIVAEDISAKETVEVVAENENVEAEAAVIEAQSENAEEQSVETAEVHVDNNIAEAQANAEIERIAELEAEVEELRKCKAELDRINAEKLQAELDQKKAKLTEYAASEGLDTDSALIASAIEKLDHETIVAEIMAMKENSKQNTNTVVYAASFDIKPTGGFSYLLESE